MRFATSKWGSCLFPSRKSFPKHYVSRLTIPSSAEAQRGTHLEGGGKGSGGILGGLRVAQAGQHALNDVAARPVAGRQRLAVHVYRALRPHRLPDSCGSIVIRDAAAAAQRAQQCRPRRVPPKPASLQAASRSVGQQRLFAAT